MSAPAVLVALATNAALGCRVPSGAQIYESGKSRKLYYFVKSFSKKGFSGRSQRTKG